MSTTTRIEREEHVPGLFEGPRSSRRAAGVVDQFAGGRRRAIARLFFLRLVKSVAVRLPSAAVESDRYHPIHPERPSARTYGRTKVGEAWTPSRARYATDATYANRGSSADHAATLT